MSRPGQTDPDAAGRGRGQAGATRDPGFAAQVGVDPDEGAEQLTAQAAHIEVLQSELRGATG